MIYDGYSRHIVLKSDSGRSFNVVYRPALTTERDQFYWLSEKLQDQRLRFETFVWIRNHVVTTDVRNWEWLEKNHPNLVQTAFNAICGIVVDSSGKLWCDIEEEYARNLHDGILLLRRNPKLASRSCEDCQRYWYNDKTGEVLVSNSTGEKELRPEGTVTMCRTSTGCLKGTPDNQKTLNRANKWALRHYQGCKSTGQFPDDEIVKKNAVIIERALAEKIK